MVQIFRSQQQQPNYLEQIAGKFGEGLSEGLSAQLTKFHDRKKSLENIPKSVKSFSGYFSKGTFDPETLLGYEKRAKELIEGGFAESPDDAVRMAYAEHQDKLTRGPEGKKPPQSKTQEALEALKSGSAAMGTFPVGLASQPFELLSEIGKLGRAGIGKLAGLSPEQMQEREAKLSGDIAAGEKATGIPSLLGGTSLSQAYHDVTGGRSVAKTPTQRILQQAVLGPVGLVGGAAEEAARGLGLPEEYLPLANITGLVTGGKLASGLTNVIMNAARKLPAFKTASKAATSAGVPPEAIVEEAASKLQGRGVDLTKVAEGDAAAVSELNKEIKKTSQAFKETERFAPKKERARREKTFEAIKESPLEKYYAPKAEKGAKAQAAEELRVAPLRERAESLKGEVQQAYKAMLDAENILKKSKGRIPEEQMARVQATAELNRLNHARMLNELKNTEFEIRNAKRPATTEEISKQIDESFAKLREGIKDPNAEKVRDVHAKLEKDRGVIEQAQKLAERGEIPGPEVFDEYIKIHKQYGDAYKLLQEELSSFIKDNQSIKGKAQRVENARALRNLVKDMQRANEAKIINQVDKRKAMRALDKPSGAFYRKMLGDIKKDIAAFQKQFFEARNITQAGEGKIAQAAKKPLAEVGEVQKVAKAAVKNPTAENVEKLATQTGLKKESLMKDIDDFRAKGKVAAEKVESGKAKEADIQNLAKDLLNKYQKLPPLKRSVVGGFVLGTLQALGEEYLGYKPTATQVGLAATLAGAPKGRGRLTVAAGAGTLAPFIYKYIRGMFESAEAKKLRSSRNTPEFSKKRKNLEERYGKTKANRIIKEATEQ